MLIEDIEKYVIERTEEFKKELNEEVKQMIKEANQGQVKSIWDLKKEDGEDYYRLYSDGDIEQVVFYTNYDEQARDIGNVFLTREEAEFEVERREIEAIMRKYSRPFKYDEYNYHIEYYHDDNTLCIGVYRCVSVGTPCFETKKIARKVIDEIGGDRLKKYWFGVKE
ncbi:MAG: hypothetical protein ACTTKH_00810 [Treponema sp.]